MRSGDVRFRGRARHFVIDVIVRFRRSCLANLRGVRDPAAQLAFELEDAKSDYGLGVAPVLRTSAKSKVSVLSGCAASSAPTGAAVSDIAELEDWLAVWGTI